MNLGWSDTSTQPLSLQDWSSDQTSNWDRRQERQGIITSHMEVLSSKHMAERSQGCSARTEICAKWYACRMTLPPRQPRKTQRLCQRTSGLDLPGCCGDDTTSQPLDDVVLNRNCSLNFWNNTSAPRLHSASTVMSFPLSARGRLTWKNLLRNRCAWHPQQ